MLRTALKHLAAALCLAPTVGWPQSSPDSPSAAAPVRAVIAVADTSAAAYTHALPGLTAQQAEQFALGHRMFNNRWAFFWFENAEFGRGPTSNAQACSICHANNGRGVAPGTPMRVPANAQGEARDHHIPVAFEPALNMVVRLSLKEPGPR